MACIFSGKKKWVSSSDKRGRRETGGGLRPPVEVWKFCLRTEMGQFSGSQRTPEHWVSHVLAELCESHLPSNRVLVYSLII